MLFVCVFCVGLVVCLFVFSKACCNRTRGSGFKLQEGRLRVDKEIFAVTLAQVAHRVDASSLGTLQVQLNGAHCRKVGLDL